MEAPAALDVLRALDRDPKLRDVLTRALEHEAAHRDQPYYTGFSWKDLGHGIDGRGLAKLAYDGILTVSYHSGKGTDYRVVNPAAVQEALAAAGQPTPAPAEPEWPDDLFDVVVGLEEIKRLLRLAIDAERPVHVLLEGDPATAKTTLLMELCRLPRSRLLLAGTMTRAGLIDFLLETDTRYLVVDELDKGKGPDLSTLLSIMESGIVTRLQHGRREHERRIVTVFAAANRLAGIPAELLSRFMRVRLEPYTQDELRAVIEAVLVRREDCDPEFAREVALLVAPRSSDPRRARDIARLSRGDRKLARELAGQL